MVDEKAQQSAVKKLSKFKKPVYLMSIYDDASIKAFADTFVKMLRTKENKEAQPENKNQP